MFDKFGEFDSWEEINKAAEGQKEEGDLEALKELAKENGILEEDVDYFVKTEGSSLCNDYTAAIGKLDIEKSDKKIAELIQKTVAGDWVEYIETLCEENENIRIGVRRKGKRLSECIGMILKWSFDHRVNTPQAVKEAAGIGSQRVDLGIPKSLIARKIIKEYYLGR